MSIRIVLLAVVAMLACSGAAAAQTYLPVGSGDQIRVVSVVGSGAYILQTIRGDTLVLHTTGNGARLEVPLASVERLERRWGRDHGRGIRNGILYGGGIGAVTGAALGLAAGDDPPSMFFSFTAEEKAVILGTYFGALGALTGAVIGLIAPPSYWVPVQLPARATMAPALGRGAGVSISLAF